MSSWWVGVSPKLLGAWEKGTRKTTDTAPWSLLELGINCNCRVIVFT